MNYKQILKGPVAVVLAVLVTVNTADGVYYHSSEALIVAMVLLSIFNVFLKPLLMFFSLPFIVLTFGLGILIINACLFLLVAALVNGFYVESFWSALWGAFVLGTINLIASIYLGDSQGRKFTAKINLGNRSQNTDTNASKGTIRHQPKTSLKDDDVIDI